MSQHKASRRTRRNPRRRRIVTVAGAVLATLAVCAGYLIADVADVLPGVLTLQPVERRAIPARSVARAAGVIAGDLDAGRAVDADAANALIDAFAATAGLGGDFSVAIADAGGAVVAERHGDTPREPASTMKTLTALAAASTLDMGSTLDTHTYLIQGDDGDTLVLEGGGDMLLSAGQSDPDHVNGRAGLATLAERTATALRQRGVSHVALRVDDTLFGQDRYPDTVEFNNPDNLYYTGVSSMAIDGGRQWADGEAPADPDTFSAYPTLSQTTAADAADVFVARLAEQGISVDGEVADGTAPDGLSPIATVRSATLAEVLAFTMRHSDNTLAEEFGRLTALASGHENSPSGGTAAVRDVLNTLGVDTTGLTMADCSGLSVGSLVSVRTLVGVQAHNLTASGAAAAGEGLSVPGLVGTAANRAVSDDTLGLLRVKTGSLGEVTSMSGTVSRIDGGALAFAVVVNAPEDMAAARAAIDVFVDALASL